MLRTSLIAFAVVSAVSLSGCDTSKYEEFVVPDTTAYTTTATPTSGTRTAYQSQSSAHDGSVPCLNNRACGT